MSVAAAGYENEAGGKNVDFHLKHSSEVFHVHILEAEENFFHSFADLASSIFPHPEVGQGYHEVLAGAVRLSQRTSHRSPLCMIGGRIRNSHRVRPASPSVRPNSSHFGISRLNVLWQMRGNTSPFERCAATNTNTRITAVKRAASVGWSGMGARAAGDAASRGVRTRARDRRAIGHLSRSKPVVALSVSLRLQSFWRRAPPPAQRDRRAPPAPRIGSPSAPPMVPGLLARLRCRMPSRSGHHERCGEGSKLARRRGQSPDCEPPPVRTATIEYWQIRSKTWRPVPVVTLTVSTAADELPSTSVL
jgi:hypothetical protein